MKIDALSFSWAGDKYLGRSYKEMDCQAFVEQCMADSGLRMDLGGSNSWYREITRNGWTGTPEDCVKVFGSVPKGALLFILEQDGREPEKYRADGIGNASHIGIVTGRGKGAIHSSSSQGCVAESEFHNKTIKNGGWNRVGLWNRLDYGKTVNWLLEHMGIGSAPAEDKKEEGKTMKAIVTGPNGETVNLREKASTNSGRIMKVPDRAEAEILETKNDWSRIRVLGKTGWMMSEFLTACEDDGDEDFSEGDLGDDDTPVTLTFTAGELRVLLLHLDTLTDKIAAKVGRG